MRIGEVLAALSKLQQGTPAADVSGFSSVSRERVVRYSPPKKVWRDEAPAPVKGNTMKLKGPRVVIRRLQMPDRIGRIWIPDRARKRTVEGTVVMIGDRVTELHVGDRVLFPSRQWSVFPPLGDEHVLLWERDVLGVLTEETNL